MGKSIFPLLLIHPKFDVVNTCSSYLVQPPLSALGAFNNPELMDFLKSMVESMEVLRKQKEDLNIWLTTAEARNN